MAGALAKDRRESILRLVTVFADSSALFAALDDGDPRSARARELLGSGEAILITDHVLVESWLLANARLGGLVADRFWDRVRRGATRVELVSAVDLEAAWRIGEAFADQDFSIVDRTSFAVMERLGVTRAISFDDDFAIYRFGPRRERAFELLR